MPYKLFAPKAGVTPYWQVRGTEFGIYRKESTRTSKEREAREIMRAWRDEAKRLSLSGPKPEVVTFASAAISYMQSGRSRLFLAPLIEHFGETPIADIDQEEMDRAAAILGPRRKPQTNNRLVYTPALAVLHHAGDNKRIRRPKIAGGGHRVEWLRPSDAFALLSAGEQVDARLGALLTFLLYTGVRLSEALRLEWKDVDLGQSTATIGRTKNGSPITVHLTPEVVAGLANLRHTKRLFGLAKSGRLYVLLGSAARHSGIDLPSGSAFHILRHTHITWRRLYAGQDTAALLEVGLHKSPRMVERYTHLDVTEEARKADLLPVPTPSRRQK